MDTFSEDFFSPISNDELEPTTETEHVDVVENIEPAETVEQTEEAVETEAPAVVEPRMVPLSAVQAERQRAKDAYDQVNALRQQLANYEANQREVPDPYDDPQAFYAHQADLVQQQVQQALVVQRFTESQARAVAAHGQDFVNEVADWAEEIAAADPTFVNRVYAQTDPAAWVIEQKKRSDMLKEFEADPDAYVMARAAKLGLASFEQTEAPQPMARKPIGPKSLATAKSRDTASNLPDNPADAFDAIFRKQ